MGQRPSGGSLAMMEDLWGSNNRSSFTWQDFGDKLPGWQEV
jgi:hypothetical protein